MEKKIILFIIFLGIIIQNVIAINYTGNHKVCFIDNYNNETCITTNGEYYNLTSDTVVKIYDSKITLTIQSWSILYNWVIMFVGAGFALLIIFKLIQWYT